MKKRIQFLIIGAPRSGTTTLYNYLSQHPNIWLPAVKENAFFARDELYTQGEVYLDAIYRGCEYSRIVGGNYVHSMFFPRVAERLHRYNAELKLIATLRNPVDRAYSSYWFAKNNNWENLPFEEALDKETQRSKGSYIEQAELTHLSHGHYCEQLERYIELFGRSNLHVTTTDALENDPKQVLCDVLTFLGADPDGYKIGSNKKSNEAALPRINWLNKLIMKQDAWHKIIARNILSPRMRYLFQTHVTDKIVHAINRKPFSYPPMKPETKQMLKRYYAPEIEKLSKLLRQDFSFWE